MENHAAKQIAREGLDIGAIKLSPKKPFLWASGFYMPIYNDNRMFLGKFEHRMMVAGGFVNLIHSEKIPYDYIAGTSTAGIAPAASVANLLGVPLIIIEDGKPYVFEQPFTVEVDGDFDGIASTCPWAIPFGVSVANEKKLPFMYVRQSKKEHGLKQQIEGIPVKGQKVLLLDYHRNDSYLENAVTALEEKGIKVEEIISKDVSGIVKPCNIEGKQVPVIEDLISTGGSSAKTVQDVRDAGAISNHCLSIFNYGLDKAAQAFAALDPKCYTHSQLIYGILMEVIVELGKFSEEQITVLKKWRPDPFNWGEKHGFPRE